MSELSIRDMGDGDMLELVLQDGTGDGNVRVYVDTTAHWAEKTAYIPERGDMVVYCDRNVDGETEYPGVKIGDGETLLADLPFTGDDIAAQILAEVRAHTGDADIHVSAEDRQRWNSMSGDYVENVVMDGETVPKENGVVNLGTVIHEHQDISGKLDAPEEAGTEGQVLTLDGNGDPTWQDPTGGDPTQIIDDNAGSGVTDKVWSANKSYTQLNLKAPKNDPAFTGCISMGRRGSPGSNSTAMGLSVSATAMASHAEGSSTNATGLYSHAEGNGTTASGLSSHAEGAATTASGDYAHTEGHNTIATGDLSHVSGIFNVADSYDTWPEWVANTPYHVGDKVKRVGMTGTYGFVCRIENSDAVFTSSKWIDQEGRMNFAEIVGNGINNTSRSNARALDWEGNMYLKGDLYVQCGPSSNGGMKVSGLPYVTSANNGDVLGVVNGEWTVDSGKAPKDSPEFTTSVSMGRKPNTDVGVNSVATGYYVEASSYYAHAEGYQTTASGADSHAEGANTTASGNCSHTEGYQTTASGLNSHAEGQGGTYTKDGTAYTSAAVGTADHTEGYQCMTASNMPGNHAEGYQTRATGGGAHSEGSTTLASGFVGHAEGQETTASGDHSHAEGYQTTASGGQAHAEGSGTTASGHQTHAEGYRTTASGLTAHAEGVGATASGYVSHAEGTNTTASGAYSHVSGKNNVADSYDSWPEWAANTSYAVGDKVKRTSGSGTSQTVTGYICKTANSDSTFTVSKWTDKYGEMNYAEIVGNGTSYENRSNARALDWDGNERLKGDLYVGCNSDSTGGTKVATDDQVIISDSQPSATDNKLWVDSDATQEYQIPTYTELTDLQSQISGKQDAPETAGTAGQVLGLNNDLEPEWVDQTGGGTSDYDDLTDKPQINGVTLSGNKTSSQLGLPTTQDVQTAANTWLNANITNPDSPPLDRSLSSSSAAAPADMVGGLLKAHKVLSVGTITENVTLTSDGKGTTANNGRKLSDFIPVTHGSRVFITIGGTTERCAFYSSADYADVVGSVFTIASGSPSYKDVPAGCYYMKIGWKDYPPTELYTVAPFIEDTAGSGSLDKVWSANKTAAEKNALVAEIADADTNITAIVNKTQFETVSATVESGYYKNDGTRGNGSNYSTATTTVTAGEILKVSGYTLANTAFSLIIWFDSNNAFLSKAYTNAGTSAETYTDLIVTVPQGAAKIGVNAMNSNVQPVIKRMATIASTTQLAVVDGEIAGVSQKTDDVGRCANYESVEEDVNLGFYNSVTGAWSANTSFGTIKVSVSPGDCCLVTGQVGNNAGMALVIFFDDQNAISSKMYDGSSGAVNAVDKFIYVSDPNAVSMAVLGAYYSDNTYYPKVKRGIIKYAHQKKYGICFGDSTFGNANSNHDIPHWLSLKTYNDVKNGAFGGCRMSVHSGNYDAFSMYRLAYSIVNNDWTLQDAALADTGFEPPAYASEHLANLKNADWDNIDFITIAYGTNDWRGGNALDNENNPTDTSTIGGALRYSLNLIMAEYPQIDVYVLSPIWRVVMQEGDTEGHPTGYCDTTPNGLITGAYYLKDVVDLLKSISEEYHVTFVDDYNLGINKYNWEHWLVDGTHPNDNGKMLMTDNLIKNVKGLVI